MHTQDGCADLVKFSPRERQIIACLISAKQISEIALALHLAPNTVKSYVKGIYLKAGVHSARELMLKFPLAEHRADDRLESFSRMLAATDTVQLHAAVLGMLRAWAGANRAFCWEVSGDDAAGMVVRPCGMKPFEYSPATECVNGPRLMRASAVSQDAFLRAASAGRPLRGDVCLTLVHLMNRTWLVALGDPSAGSFAPDVLGLVRMLVRLAEHHAELFRPRAAALAVGSTQRRAV